MRIAFLLFTLFWSITGLTQVNEFGATTEISHREYGQVDNGRFTQTNINRAHFDVTKQVLYIDVDPAIYYLKGQVNTSFKVLKPLSKITLDCSPELVIDSLFLGVKRLYSFEQKNQYLIINLGETLAPTSQHELRISYQGKPNSSRAFMTDTTPSGSPVAWTLSEPYGARDWWPCKQDLQDKIDSLEVVLKVPNKYKAVANGVLQNETAIDSHKVYHFKHNYPIVSYLVAFAVADYAYFEETLDLPSGPLKFINYVYKEDSLKAWQDLRTFKKTISLFDSLFGEYPFAKEHYGHAQFGWGGGMEHQGISFMYNFNHGLVAHELAHQWFGNKITCASWQDLWLNEGFATYLEGLSYDFLFPEDKWIGWKQNTIANIVERSDGSVFIRDTTDRSRMFDQRLTYKKGAYLLHMLRGQMGEKSFFEAIKSYVNDEKLIYHFAQTKDLIWHLKKTAPSDFDVDEFFKDWYYAQGWPKYRIEYYQDEYNKVYIALGQEQSHIWEGTFFEMKVPIKIVTDHSTETYWLKHNYDGQQYTIQLDHKIRTFTFDASLWILSGENIVQEIDYRHSNVDYKIAPNPVKETARIYFSNTILPGVEVEVYDMLGNVVWRREVELGLGSNHFDLHFPELRAGSYVLSVKDYYNKSTLRFTKI